MNYMSIYIDKDYGIEETRLYVNIAHDCESFKAIKGNTRLYKAKVILSKQKQGHSFLLVKAYERSHKSDNMYM